MKGQVMEEVYYGNMINLSGLYSDKPIKCAKQGSSSYWDEEGDFDINPNKLGIEIRDGYIKFTSSNEKEVQLWTDGVIASMKIMKKWCS